LKTDETGDVFACFTPEEDPFPETTEPLTAGPAGAGSTDVNLTVGDTEVGEIAANGTMGDSCSCLLLSSAFIDSSSTACVGTTASFFASTSGGYPPFTYEWDFDYDGFAFDAEAAGQSVGHVYFSTGSYTVALRVRDSCPDGPQEYLVEKVLEITPLYFNPYVSPATACLGLNQYFQVSSVCGKTGYTFEWDFDYDGQNFDVMANGSSFYYIHPGGAGAYTVAMRWYPQSDPSQWSISTATVTVTANQPAVQWDSYFNPALTLTPICHDGNTNVEPGEEWRVTAALANVSGCSLATGVRARLAVNPSSMAQAFVCVNPGYFGDLLSGQSGTVDFNFVVDAAASCVGSLVFDLAGITSNEGAYPSKTAFFTVQVGMPPGEPNATATQANPLSGLADGAAYALLQPSMPIATPVESAQLSFSVQHTADVSGCMRIDLIAPDNSVLTVKNFGEPYAGPYDVAAFYNAHGPGTWQLRAVEFDGVSGGSDCNAMPVAPQEVLLSPFADTYIWQAQPTSGFGSGLEMVVGFSGGPFSERRAMMEFTGLPGGVALSAVLELFATQGGSVPRTHSVQRNVLPWDESNYWNNTFVPDAYVWGSVDTQTGAGWKYSTDITPLVQGWMDADFPNYGVTLMGDDAVDTWPYSTKEGIASPLLRVNYVPAHTGSLEDGALAVVKNSGVECDMSGCGCALMGPSEVSPPGAAQELVFEDVLTLVWEEGSLSGSDVFNVYRGDIAELPQGNYGTCLATSIPGYEVGVYEDPSPAPAGTAWFYLVSGVNAVGEGTLGRDWLGFERFAAWVCP
jgi:hypothetical protein